MDPSGLTLLLSVLLSLNIVSSKNQKKKMFLKFINLHILLFFLALSSCDKDAKKFKLIEESIH